MNPKTLFLLSFLMGTLLLTAQETQIYTYKDKAYLEALALYHDQQYQAAQLLFEKVQRSTEQYHTQANSAYYAASAAIRLHQSGAEQQMEAFVAQYPTSPKRNMAYLEVADYYFDTGKYVYALKWYEKVAASSLSRAQRERLYFNKGYALYVSQKPQEAEQYFSKVSNSPKYGQQAEYYLGYIAYQQDHYAEASTRFSHITDPRLRQEMAYYQADLLFKQANYKEAIALAQKRLPKAKPEEASELNKIIGESYFNLGNYQEALPFLKEYQGKPNNTDYYRIGYCYYKEGAYENAIQQFNKIVDATDTLAQNAYHHLAACYLEMGKKSEALNAFRKASQMTFSPDLQKEALRHYARLSYEIGNPYEPVSQVLMAYLEKYPEDAYQAEFQELLVDSYVTSGNFKAALQQLEQYKKDTHTETYQKVAYYRGLELFTARDYIAALAHFSKSLQNATNQAFQAKALYWRAEAAYRLERYSAALKDFEQLQNLPAAQSLPQYPQLAYHLAYCYLKQKDYTRAISPLKDVVNTSALDKERLDDGYLRLGDSYFMTRNYQLAQSAYEKALQRNTAAQDYAAFQKAMCIGFLNDKDAKIKALQAFLPRYPQSAFQDDALFALANTYVAANRESDGLRTYTQLLREHPDSKLAPQALLQQGLVSYNTGRNPQALAKLQQVIRLYPNTPEAQQAVAAARGVYIDEGRPDEYAAWVRNLGFVTVADTELEQAIFETAQKKYAEGKTATALKWYKKYLETFPSGFHTPEVNFVLAQHYLLEGDKDKALPQYLEVIAQGNNQFVEQALVQVCKYYIAAQDYPSALPHLQQLERIAEVPQHKAFAQTKLMKAHYHQKKHGQTLAYAKKVLASSQTDAQTQGDAHFIMARTAIATQDTVLAQAAYQKVKETATGAQAAEAWYYDAYFKNKKQAYEASNVAVQTLVSTYPAYKEWSAKGLVVMAKNFYSLGDVFQATYILESAIANFSDYPTIVAEAQEVLSKIKAREAHRNAVLYPNGN